MINQPLLDYIKQQLQRGVSKEQIKSSLMGNGWEDSDIEEAFASVGVMPSMIPPSPASAFHIQPTSNITNPSVSPVSQPAANFTNSTVSVSYAGFWRRVAAAIVDGFFVNLILAIIGFLYFWFFTKNSPTLSNSAKTILGISSFVISIIYFPFMESRGGATLGKKIIGIKVLRDNGQPVGFLRSLGRHFAKIISGMIFMIGFLMAGFTKKKQALHDMIAGCVVVKSRETSVGKIWAIIILFIVVYVGALVAIAVVMWAQLFLIFSTMFSGGLKINNQTEIPPVVNQETNQTPDQAVPTQPSPQNSFVPSTDVQNWKTYQNLSLGISFNYPPDWEVKELFKPITIFLQNYSDIRDPQAVGEVNIQINSYGKIFNCSTQQCQTDINKWAQYLHIQNGVVTKINNYDAIQGYVSGGQGISIAIRSGDKGYSLGINQFKDLQLNDTVNKIITSLNLAP